MFFSTREYIRDICCILFHIFISENMENTSALVSDKTPFST